MQNPLMLHLDQDWDDLLFFSEALKLAHNNHRLIALQNPVLAQKYILGSDEYAERSKFPLPDLVVTDLFTPLDAGYQFLHWLRQECKAPVFVLCSPYLLEDIQPIFDAGVSEAFPKPVFPSEWQSLAREILNTFASPVAKSMRIS